MKVISIKQAYNLFNSDVLKCLPVNVTKDWRVIMQINAIIGKASLAGYSIQSEFDLYKHISKLEKENKISIKNIINFEELKNEG